MTKEQKADALLKAAKIWESGNVVEEAHVFWNDGWRAALLDDYGHKFGTVLSSAALSEVAGLGFDIVNGTKRKVRK